MFYHQWLSSPFSCSALKDMESGLLTVTSIGVMNLPPIFTWSGFWLHQYKSLQHIPPSHLLLLHQFGVCAVCVCERMCAVMSVNGVVSTLLDVAMTTHTA